MKRLAIICISLTLALALVAWGPTVQQGRIVLGPRPAWACGLGQPQTMTADGQPAVATPILPTTPSDAPTGLFPGQYSVNETVNFTEDLSRLPTPINTNLYQWKWDYGDGQTGSGFKTTHTYAKPGTYAVRLQLVDPHDPTNSDPNFDSSAITVIDQHYANPPVARITASDTFVQLDTSLSYDATGSHSLVGGDVTYTWDFNDTSDVAHNAQVTHKFILPGRTFVALIVKDARGAVSVATVPVVVALELPKAQLTASSLSADTGASLTFDASQSAPTSQPGDAIVKYHWTFGDGADVTTSAATITHSFAKAGSYVVKMQAINKGALAGTARLTVRISDAGFLGLGSKAPVLLGGFGVVIFLLLLGVLGNLVRERREMQQRLALEAARRTRAQNRRAAGNDPRTASGSRPPRRDE
jgi:PKD repeat protein